MPKLLPVVITVCLLLVGLPAAAQVVPIIEKITPNPAVGGDQVVITGAGFGSFNTINLTGPQANLFLNIPGISGTQLFFRLPPTISTGTYQLTVSTLQGTSNPLALAVQNPQAAQPTTTPPVGGVAITEIIPTSAPVGTRITIRGVGFGSYNTISFTGHSDQAAVAATSINGAVLFVTIPTQLSGGTYQVTVSNALGTSNAVSLNVQGLPGASPAPSISPAPGPGPSLTYVALGDSVTRGFLGLFTYVGFYRDHLEADRGVPVEVNNLAVSGWTSAQLREGLQHDEKIRAAVRGAQVLTWNIGGNDLRRAREQYMRGTCGGPRNQDCLRLAVDNFKTNWEIIVREISTLRAPGATIKTMDIYYPFVDEDGPHFAALNPYFTEVNRTIASTSAAAGIPVAPAHTAFNGLAGNQDPDRLGYLTFDGYHPGRLGHKVIADLLRQ